MIKKKKAEALNNRGNALQDLTHYEEALASFDWALALESEYVDALNNRGNALCHLERLADGLASYDSALALKPDYAGAHSNESLCRLLIGDIENGWPKYEWRWQDDQLKKSKRDFKQPLLFFIKQKTAYDVVR